MTDTRREQEKDERRKLQEQSRQNEAETMRLLAFEAGRQLAEIPKEAKGNEPLLENYKSGLQETRKELETTPDATKRALLQRLAAVRGRLSLCADQAAAAK
ncbi:hypothetical protein, partial [Enterobacter hormaechei]